MDITSAVRQLYYLRYPILFGILFAGIGPFIWFRMRRLLGNILIVHRWYQVAALTVICLTAAGVLAVQLWIIHTNGGQRFGADWGTVWDIEHPSLLHISQPIGHYWTWSWLGTIAWAIAGFSLPVVSVLYSALSNSKQAKQAEFPTNVGLAGGGAGLFVGTVVFLGLMLLASFLSQRFLVSESKAERLLPVEKWYPVESSDVLYGFGSSLAKILSSSPNENGEASANGYAFTIEKDGKSVGYLAPGHGQLIIVSLLIFIHYVTSYYLGISQKFTDPTAKILPTTYYLMLLLQFASLVFSALSFYLDYYRVPTLLIVPILLMFAYRHIDHYFRVRLLGSRSSTAGLEAAVPAMPSKLLSRSVAATKEQKKTLVAITAPGGGIHAAAWTVRVLTGLQERYNNEFTKSIGMISAVSGGSAGLIHYLNAFSTLQGYKDDKDLGAYNKLARKVLLDASASSLEAVGWGLVFPDLTRIVWPWIKTDRAIVVERLWNDLMSDRVPAGSLNNVPTLRDWGQRTDSGELPGFVFNATEVESGRRVLFTTLPLKTRPKLDARKLSPRLFRDLYIDSDANAGDIDIATCARLSATFPYVFPSAISEDVAAGGQETPGCFGHVVDGGYVDNEGIVTTVDWLSQLLAEGNAADEFDRVVLIRIRHHAPELSDGPDDQPPKPDSGFISAVAGPALAVASVRDTSQAERGQIEADLLKQARTGAGGNGDFVQTVFLDFDPANAVEPPLNWKLTPKQFAAYDDAWTNLEKNTEAGEGLKQLDDFFERESV